MARRRESRCGTCSLTPPEWEKQPTKKAKTARTLSDLVPAFASKPLAFAPGSKWKYCQSGILTLGRIVEIVSGVPFEVFLRKRIFDPLGMKDTTFYLTAAQMPRWVIPAKREGEKLVPAENRASLRPSSTWGNHYPASNAGLFSVAKIAEDALNRNGYHLKVSIKTDQKAVYVTERKISPPASLEVAGSRNQYVLSLHALPSNVTRLSVKADFEKTGPGWTPPQRERRGGRRN